MSGEGGDGNGGSPLAGLDEGMRDRFAWYPVAKKEFKDTVRSKLLWVLSAVFVVVFALPAFLGLYFDIGQLTNVTTDTFFQVATRLGSALVPLVAIVVGYGAIISERESGSLKVLLSLPFSRRDVVVGKVLGRSAVVAIPILIGFVVSLLVLVVAQVSISPVGFVLATLLTALLGVVFVGLSVGVSAAATTGRRAIVATMGIYVYFFLFWNSFSNSVGGLLRQHLDVSVATSLKASLFLKLLNPTQSYQTLVNSALGDSPMTARTVMYSGLRSASVCQEALGGNVSMTQTGGLSCAPEGASIPLYFSDIAVLGYLLLWIAVPLYIGYALFDAADL